MKNQKWMRQKNFQSVQLTETNDPLTMHTLEIIERVCKYSQNGLSSTLGRFLDKIGFFEHLADTLFQSFKQEDLERQADASMAKSKGQSFAQSSAQEDRNLQRNRRFSQKRLTNAEGVANDKLNLDQDLSTGAGTKNLTHRNNAKAFGHASASR